MCLAVPGKLIEIFEQEPSFRSGRVDFAGIVKEVNLAYVPEAKINDYVIVHVGFAISILDEEEAKEVFRYLAQIDGLAELKEGSQ